MSTKQTSNKKGDEDTPEETWHGLPRSKIPWYPTIDYKTCVSCGKCVDYCKLGTYEFEEKGGKKRPIVKNPNNCVVLCTAVMEYAPLAPSSIRRKKKPTK